MWDLAVTLGEQGHSVALLTDSPDAPTAELQGVSVRVISPAAAPRSWLGAAPETARHSLMHAGAAYREVRRLHDEERSVDAVLAPLWRAEGAVCSLDGRFPTIVTCMTSLRTLSELDPGYHELEDLDTRMALECGALRRSDYLHGLTETVLEKTINDHGLEPRARAVIGRGVRDRGGQHSEQHQGRVVPRVLFVGRIEHRKGVDTLLQAARQLVAEGIKVQFTLVGRSTEGPLRASFERQAARDPEFGRAVRFAGVVTDEELGRLYDDADVVCLPSRYESHGVVLIEAMMHGRPIVSCAAGGIPEVVEPGVNALLTPPEDPSALAVELRKVILDRELRERLGRAGRKAYERRFDARHVASRMAAFFEQVAAEHRPSPASDEQIRERLEELLLEAGLAGRDSAAALAGELLSGSADAPSRVAADAGETSLEPTVAAAETRRAIREAALANPPEPRPADGAREPRVSVVLLTRDRPEFLPLALDSVLSQDVACEVIVIDQGSEPAAAAATAAACERRSGVQLHRNERNLGTSAGRNLGVGLSERELILFLDDDAELMPGALAHMVDVLDGDPAAVAVSATVITPDGLISHSGGSLELGEGVAGFALTGFGEPFEDGALAPTGPADWLGATALLARRSLLEEFPFDGEMRTYYEDNEWCFRVSLARPGCLRRSRDALALHHLAGRVPGAVQEISKERLVALLAACARFYEIHGLLIGPWSWELMPERAAGDGSLGLSEVRLLMELITAKGPDWTLAAWSAGELDGLVMANRRRVELERAEAELEQLRPEVARLNRLIFDERRKLDWVFERERTLQQIEAGGWWRLGRRLAPLLGSASRLRSALVARRR